MSSHTPTRISLRRKRVNNEAKQEDPLPKRMSPSLDNDKDEVVSTHRDISENVEENICLSKISISSFSTPKSCKRRGTGTVTKTPTAIKENASSNSLQDRSLQDFSSSQSPAQFPSSQMLPSVQDCEVVWDCNSPGYSKDDLKKMSGYSGDKSSTPSPIAPVPNRLLFGKLKRRAWPPSPHHMPSRLSMANSSAVAAELDSLLTKVNEELIKKRDDEELEEEFPQDISNILNVSSQPFDISDIHPNDSFNNVKELPCEKSVNDSPFTITKQSLDCNIAKASNSMLNKHCPVANGNSSTINSNVISNTKNDMVISNMSFSSMDDDDLFNESFLKSTQALEDALFNKETGKYESPSVLKVKRHSPLSRIRKRIPVNICDDTLDSCISKPKNLEKILHDRSPVTRSSVSNDRLDNKCLSNQYNIGTVKKKLPIEENHTFNSQNASKACLVIDNNDANKNNIQRQKMKQGMTDNSFKKHLFSKPDKPRSSFQLHESDSDPFCRKTFTEESRKSYLLTDQPSTSNNFSGLRTINEREAKFSLNTRSKSETIYSINNTLKKNGSLDLSSNLNITANISQESDDDDEIFASLMPKLIDMEAEHTMNLTQCVQNLGTNPVPSSSSNRNSRSSSDLNNKNNYAVSESKKVNSISVPKVSSISNTNYHNPSSKISRGGGVDTNKKYSTTTCNSNISKVKSTNNFVNKTNNLPLQSKENTQISDVPCRAKSYTGFSGTLSSLAGHEDKELTKSENLNSVKSEVDFEDDDDDLFLQDDVLDYISLVESQYIASQSTATENVANNSVKNATQLEGKTQKGNFDPTKHTDFCSQDFKVPSSTGFGTFRQTVNVSKSFINKRSSEEEQKKISASKKEEKISAKENSYLDSSFESSNDEGLGFLTKEFMKVGQTGKKLNAAIKCGHSESNFDTDTSLSNEDFLNIAFEDSLAEVMQPKLHSSSTRSMGGAYNHSQIIDLKISKDSLSSNSNVGLSVNTNILNFNRNSKPVTSTQNNNSKLLNNNTYKTSTMLKRNDTFGHSNLLRK